jgi:hypothetical protein
MTIMVKVTLTDPDMTKVWAHVAAVLGKQGVTEFTTRGGCRTWQLPNGKQLTVSWNHPQQKVLFMCGSKISKYQHVSLIAYEDQYYARMTAWIKRNVSFLAAGEKTPLVSTNRGAVKKKAATSGVWMWDKDELGRSMAFALTNLLALTESMSARCPAANVAEVSTRAVTIQAAKTVLVQARKRYSR